VTLFFTCSNNGKDELWAYVESQQSSYRLASYETGLYQTMLAGESLIASAFTANGYRLARVQPAWQKTQSSDTLTNLYVTHPFNAIDNNMLAMVRNRNYPVSAYSKSFNLFNFHSWNPYFEQPDYSVILYGQNVLNTFQSQLYYTYNNNEGYNRIGYTGIYGGWYVQPVVNINHTWSRRALLTADTAAYWNELNASAGLRLPLNLSGGKMYRNLLVSATYNYDNVHYTGIAKQFLKNLSFGYLESKLIYNSEIQQSPQHIYPRWGETFGAQFRNILNKYTAHQLLLHATLYVPGFLKTHNILINAAYQLRDTAGQYYFTNNFPFSRGYDAIDLPRTWKAGINYHLPIAYPDWGFGNIVFCKRIRLNVFYDYTVGKSLRTGNKYKFKTVGGEMYFDTRWWNQQPISFGIRYSHLLDNELVGLGANQWEIILPVSIF